VKTRVEEDLRARIPDSDLTVADVRVGVFYTPVPLVTGRVG